jgi:hypothetical protein
LPTAAAAAAAAEKKKKTPVHQILNYTAPEKTPVHVNFMPNQT